MKKTIKQIDKKYRVEKDGKNCLYVSENGGKTYEYAELVYILRHTRIKVGVGLNVYNLSNKLRRRFQQFLKDGYSIYAQGNYVYTKVYK